MENYVAVPKEKFLRLTKDVLNKTLIDSKGATIGKINEVVISNITCDDYPIVEGIITNKKYISWKNIAAISDYILLDKRFFKITMEKIDAKKNIVSKQILDEQLVDKRGVKIGRVDDLAMSYSNEDKKLKIVGICTGIHVRMGIHKYYDILPWKCVTGFQKRPRSLILDLSKKQDISRTNKVMVRTI